MLFGKKIVTEVSGNRVTETTQNVVAGNFVWPRKTHTEESIKITTRAEQDAEYIRFADEEERLQKTGRLLEAEFQIRRTPASNKDGARYAIKKFTVLDESVEKGI